MHRLPQIQILDEQLISEDERFRAEIYYTETTVGVLGKFIDYLARAFSNLWRQHRYLGRRDFNIPFYLLYSPYHSEMTYSLFNPDRNFLLHAPFNYSTNSVNMTHFLPSTAT